jgi:hypothetical protein
MHVGKNGFFGGLDKMPIVLGKMIIYFSKHRGVWKDRFQKKYFHKDAE